MSSLKKFIFTLSSLSLALAAIAIVGIIFLNASVSPKINFFFFQHSHIFCLLRLMVILFIGTGWPYFIRQLAKQFKWPLTVIDYTLSLRWRIIIFLSLFELLIVQNSFTKILHLFN